VLCGRRAGLEAASASSLQAAGERGFGDEIADAGSFAFERERELSLVGNLRDLIGKVEAALARIHDGTYGRCETCGQAIEAERLDALPYTTLCLTDARRRSRIR
jgi:DnaK suppressor protein